MADGTSKTGKVHRYYACSSRARQGQTACKGRSIRMDKLDVLVTDHMADRLLTPERLATMLTSLASRRAAKSAAVDERARSLEKEAHNSSERLARLYRLVEDGAADVDDILRGRIAVIKATAIVHERRLIASGRLAVHPPT